MIGRDKKIKLTYLLLFIAIILIIIGINNGNMVDTYNKARLICFECIGIG